THERGPEHDSVPLRGDGRDISETGTVERAGNGYVDLARGRIQERDRDLGVDDGRGWPLRQSIDGRRTAMANQTGDSDGSHRRRPNTVDRVELRCDRGCGGGGRAASD